MKEIENGADVYAYNIAKELRGLQKSNPGLLVITKAMDPPKNGKEQQPYFGAILTVNGKKELEKYGKNK